MQQIVRTWLYIVAGITSALIGWNIAQLLMADLDLHKYLWFGNLSLRTLVLFPALTISLAIGMVSNEILLNNPTRLTLCWKTCKASLTIALTCGIILGLLATIFEGIVFTLVSNAFLSRTVGWLTIGLAVGLAEGLTWWWQSIESRDPKRFQQRFWTSVIGSGVASIIAALFFEMIRVMLGETSTTFRLMEDPLGFSILGLLLGLAFSWTNSPAFQVALRAGGGFEYQQELDPQLKVRQTVMIRPFLPQQTQNPQTKTIEISPLSIIGNNDDQDQDIEEGTSIKLPGKGRIAIGNDQNEIAHIRLPEVPAHVAFLKLGKTVTLQPNSKFFYTIAINGEHLDSKRERTIRHNTVLTFYAINDKEQINDKKFYRLVFYNRFLDPQA